MVPVKSLSRKQARRFTSSYLIEEISRANGSPGVSATNWPTFLVSMLVLTGLVSRFCCVLSIGLLDAICIRCPSKMRRELRMTDRRFRWACEKGIRCCCTLGEGTSSTLWLMQISIEITLHNTSTNTGSMCPHNEPTSHGCLFGWRMLSVEMPWRFCELLGYVSRAVRPSVSWFYTKRTNPTSWEKTKSTFSMANSKESVRNKQIRKQISLRDRVSQRREDPSGIKSSTVHKKEEEFRRSAVIGCRDTCDKSAHPK